MAAALEGRIGPERLVDMLLRLGPYGDGFGRRPEGLTLAKLQAEPHGIDLGSLQPRLPEVINTVSGAIELAPKEMIDDIGRLRAHMVARNGLMLLIGRRELRWSNSFMHNLPSLVKAVGEDNILFETDFPHPTCLYPDPLTSANENMRELSETARNKILGGNAASLYRL